MQILSIPTNRYRSEAESSQYYHKMEPHDSLSLTFCESSGDVKNRSYLYIHAIGLCEDSYLTLPNVRLRNEIF